MKCLQCGKEIGANRKYCDNKCKKKYFYSNTTYSKVCIICGKEFNGRAGEKCCSQECSLKAQRAYTKTCPVCGKEFTARGNGVYCSSECYRTANSPTKGLMISTCKVCGESFRTKIENPEVVCSDTCGSKIFSVYIKEILTEYFGTTDKNQIQYLLKDNFQKEF